MAGRCVPGVAFIYDRSNTELLALLLKRVCKEYGVTNTIGNLGGSRLRMWKMIAVGPLQELDFKAGRVRFLQTLSSPPVSKVVTVS